MSQEALLSISYCTIWVLYFPVCRQQVRGCFQSDFVQGWQLCSHPRSGLSCCWSRIPWRWVRQGCIDAKFKSTRCYTKVQGFWKSRTSSTDFDQSPILSLGPSRHLSGRTSRDCDSKSTKLSWRGIIFDGYNVWREAVLDEACMFVWKTLVGCQGSICRDHDFVDSGRGDAGVPARTIPGAKKFYHVHGRVSTVPMSRPVQSRTLTFKIYFSIWERACWPIFTLI